MEEMSRSEDEKHLNSGHKLNMYGCASKGCQYHMPVIPSEIRGSECLSVKCSHVRRINSVLCF